MYSFSCSEVADGLCCVLTTPCLTQCTNNNTVMNPVPPVVMRNKNFNWRNIHRYHTQHRLPETTGVFPSWVYTCTCNTEDIAIYFLLLKAVLKLGQSDIKLTHENWMPSSLTYNLDLTLKETVDSIHSFLLSGYSCVQSLWDSWVLSARGRSKSWVTHPSDIQPCWCIPTDVQWLTGERGRQRWLPLFHTPRKQHRCNEHFVQD